MDISIHRLPEVTAVSNHRETPGKNATCENVQNVAHRGSAETNHETKPSSTINDKNNSTQIRTESLFDLSQPVSDISSSPTTNSTSVLNVEDQLGRDKGLNDTKHLRYFLKTWIWEMVLCLVSLAIFVGS